MKIDSELQQDVMEELRLEPSVDHSQIGVAAKEGVVTLSGFVGTYAEKVAAGRAARRVYGVRALADEIEVHLPSGFQRNDQEIAKVAADTLRWNATVPHEQISITVSKGWITLEGTVDWQFQRNAAADALEGLLGVKGVINSIQVKPAPIPIDPADVKRKIKAAFHRSAEVDARRVDVETDDGKLVLKGNVKSWAEREEAARAAWAIPGVQDVDNRLVITV